MSNQGFTFKITRLKRLNGKRAIDAMLNKAFAPYFYQAMFEILKSADQQATGKNREGGIPIVTGQAKGVLIKLARRLNREAARYNLEGLPYEIDFGDAKPRADKNSETGNLSTKWLLDTRGPTWSFKMVTAIPYWSKNEQVDQPTGKRFQRLRAWHFDEQFQRVFDDYFRNVIYNNEAAAKIIGAWKGEVVSNATNGTLVKNHGPDSDTLEIDSGEDVPF